jgi:hypothetical protein
MKNAIKTLITIAVWCGSAFAQCVPVENMASIAGGGKSCVYPNGLSAPALIDDGKGREVSGKSLLTSATAPVGAPLDSLSIVVNARDFVRCPANPGVNIGDGSIHPISGCFSTLAAAQAVYPAATALTNELAEVAIQAAANNLTGGGTVMVPQGTYYLSPSDPDANANPHHFAISIPERVEVAGAGMYITKFVVRPDGPYQHVFLSTTGSGDVGLRDFTIDHQSSLNPIKNRAEIIKYRRSTLWWKGSVANATATVRRMQVVNSVSGNDLLLTYGGGDGRNVLNRAIVEDNRFENMGGGAVSWDSSVIFAEARYLSIKNNFVQSASNSFNLHQTFCGIEVYGASGVIQGNTVKGYHTGILFGGWNLVVSENSTNTSQGGILFNSARLERVVGSTSYGLLNCSVHGNTVRIQTGAATYTSTTRSMGIGLYASQSAGSKDVAIQGNTILYDVEPDASKLNTLDRNSGGIGMYTRPATYTWENVTIENNIIEDTPYSGITTNVAMTNWKIRNNILRNCGSFPSETYAAFKYPVRITSPTMVKVDVSGNDVIDTNAISITRIAYSFSIVGSTNDSIAVTAENNKLSITDPTHSYFAAKYQTGPHALVHITD